MTRRVSASEQGQLQGANSCMMGIAGTFSPLVFTQIFAWFISEAAFFHLPGAPFFLAAVMMVIGLIIVLKAIPPVQAP